MSKAPPFSLVKLVCFFCFRQPFVLYSHTKTAVLSSIPFPLQNLTRFFNVVQQEKSNKLDLKWPPKFGNRSPPTGNSHVENNRQRPFFIFTVHQVNGCVCLSLSVSDSLLIRSVWLFIYRLFHHFEANKKRSTCF